MVAWCEVMPHSVPVAAFSPVSPRFHGRRSRGCHIADRGGDGGQHRDTGERCGQGVPVRHEPDRGRAEEHAAVAERRGHRYPRRTGEPAGALDGDGEEVGEAQSVTAKPRSVAQTDGASEPSSMPRRRPWRRPRPRCGPGRAVPAAMCRRAGRRSWRGRRTNSRPRPHPVSRRGRLLQGKAPSPRVRPRRTRCTGRSVRRPSPGRGSWCRDGARVCRAPHAVGWHQGSWRRSVGPAAAVTSSGITVSPGVPGGGQGSRDQSAETGAHHAAQTETPRGSFGMTGRRTRCDQVDGGLCWNATLIAPYAAPKTSEYQPRASAECVSGGRPRSATAGPRRPRSPGGCRSAGRAAR